MKLLVRTTVIVIVLAATIAGSWPRPNVQAAAGPTAPIIAGRSIFLPYATSSTERDVAQAFTSDQAGVVASGGGHILTVAPRSVPPYQDGAAATIALSVDVGATPPLAPPSWLRIVSPPTNFGPDNFAFNFPLTVRLPVVGVNDVSYLYFLRYDNAAGAWTRSLFAFDPDNPTTAVETTLFTLGQMAAGEWDVTTAAWHPQGGLYAPNTHCPIGAMDCFYYLTIQNFVPLYPDEVAAGVLNGNVLRLRSNVTGESPEPTGWLLPQGTYTFCYSALESPLTLTHLRKYTNTNPQTVIINQPYACGFTNTCKTTVNIGGGLDGWGEASDDRPCGMGAGIPPGNPAALGNTGDFQATLTWTNNSSSATDLDLHLYGPNGLHVFFNSKLSADGSLRLDRDWQSESGSAVENIYQQKDGTGKSIPMPSGTYSLRVAHYSGADGKPYQVRVIRNGAVSNFSGTLSSGNDRELLTFTVP